MSMEFKFLSSAACHPETSSSPTIYSSEQPSSGSLRSSPTQNPELTPREIVQRQMEMEKERIKTEIIPSSSPTQNPELAARGMVQYLMEKERTKTETISGEAARRPKLEAEVRRIIDEEVEMQGMSFQQRLAMRISSKLYMWYANEPDTHSPVLVPGLRPQLPPSPTLEAPAEVKPAVEDNKGKGVIQAKPDSNLCGAKREAATSLVEELPHASLKKKPKEEWSCALCQVSATSEKVFNGHLQGKKHLAKAAELKDQKMANKPAVAAPSTEKIGMREKPKFWCKICEIGAYSTAVMETHKKGKKHLAQLQKHVHNDKVIPSITTMEVSDVGEESKILACASEEGDEKTAEN